MNLLTKKGHCEASSRTNYCWNCVREKDTKLSTREYQEYLRAGRVQYHNLGPSVLVSVGKFSLFCRSVNDKKDICQPLALINPESYCFDEPFSLDPNLDVETLRLYILQGTREIENISKLIMNQFRQGILNEQHCLRANASNTRQLAILVQLLGTFLAERENLSELNVDYLNLVNGFFLNKLVFKYLDSDQFVDIAVTFFRLLQGELGKISYDIYVLSQHLIYYHVPKFSVKQRSEVSEIIESNYKNSKISNIGYGQWSNLKEMLNYPERFEHITLINDFNYE